MEEGRQHIPSASKQPVQVQVREEQRKFYDLIQRGHRLITLYHGYLRFQNSHYFPHILPFEFLNFTECSEPAAKSIYVILFFIFQFNALYVLYKGIIKATLSTYLAYPNQTTATLAE